MNDDLAIHGDDVHFTFPDGHVVLRGKTKRQQQSKKDTHIGPNGAGMSSFMCLLIDVEFPSRGRVRVGGLDVN